MTHYKCTNVKLSNSQLDKLKLASKNAEKVILKL